MQSPVRRATTPKTVPVVILFRGYHTAVFISAGIYQARASISARGEAKGW